MKLSCKLALAPLAIVLVNGAYNVIHKPATPSTAQARRDGPPCPDPRLCPPGR